MAGCDGACGTRAATNRTACAGAEVHLLINADVQSKVVDAGHTLASADQLQVER